MQLAKREGLRVIASSGSDDKAVFASERGADVSFNYKTDNLWDVLAREEQGVDVYFDNVGGEILNLSLTRLKQGARVVLCGMFTAFQRHVITATKILYRWNRRLQ